MRSDMPTANINITEDHAPMADDIIPTRDVKIDAVRKGISDSWESDYLRLHCNDRVEWRTRLMHLIMATGISELSPTEANVLLVLLTFGNKDGANIYPSNERVAKLVGRHVRMVERTLKSLKKKGWIETRQKRRETSIKLIAIPQKIQRKLSSVAMSKTPQNCSKTPQLSYQDPTTLSLTPDKNVCPYNKREPILRNTGKPSFDGLNLNGCKQSSGTDNEGKNSEQPVCSPEEHSRRVKAIRDIQRICKFLNGPRDKTNRAEVEERWPNGIPPELKEYARRVGAKEIDFVAAVDEIITKEKAAST